MNETKTRQRSRKALMIAEITIVVVLVMLVAAYFTLLSTSQNEYTIFDGDNIITLSSESSSIEDVLAEAGITVGNNDLVTLSSRGSITEVTIHRQNTFTVTLGSKALEASTYGTTVSDALRELDISLSEQDTMVSQGQSIAPGDKLVDGMDICITQNSEKTVTETLSIPYETVTFLDPSMAEGTTAVKTPGVDGKQEVTSLEKYVNGELVSTTPMSTRLISNPVTEVILVGSGETLSGEGEAAVMAAAPEADTEKEDAESDDAGYEESEEESEEATDEEPEEDPAYEEPEEEYEEEYEEPEEEYEEEYEEPEEEYEEEYEEPEEEYEEEYEDSYSEPSYSGNTITTSSGEVLYYSECFTVEATAYTGGGTTATGTPARYGAIAVDPDVIPYGTRMYIVSCDGNWVYGVATAEDCGGAINGYIIDLYFDSYDTCIQFGRRDCTVYILD